MKKTITKITIILITLSLLSFSGVLIITAESDENRGREIMEKVDSQPTPKNQISSQTMVIRKSNNTYTKSFDIYSKEVDENTSLSLVEFTGQTNIKVLSKAYKDKEDEVWVKMTSGAPRRIIGSEKKGDYMGSHFTYDDMEEYDFDDFEYKYKGEGNINGELHYLVETVKKDGNWSYSKMRNYVRAKDYTVSYAEMYDKNNQKTKKLTIKYKKFDKYNIPIYMEMKMLKVENQWTKMGVIDSDDDGRLDIDVDVSESKLPDSLFNKDSL